MFILTFIVNCGTLYVPQILPDATGIGQSRDQENFEVDVISITKETIQDANKTPYMRRVVDASDLKKPAELVSVSDAINQQLPPETNIGVYELGIGDVLTISQFIDQPTDEGFQRTFTSREVSIADDGYVSILGVPRLRFAGLTQFEAEDLLYETFAVNQINPQFELNISEFQSKKIYVSQMSEETETKNGNYFTIPYTNIPIFMHQLLAQIKLSFKKGEDQLVILKRKNEIFRMSLKAVIDGTIDTIRLLPEDRIFIEMLPYRTETAIIAGEVRKPKIIDLTAFERQSLVEALYNSDGVFVTGSSDTSQIYVLRQNTEKSIRAFHLDASDPSRLTLAAKFELRPNDIIFVSPQFVTNYNRALTQVFSAYAITSNAELAVSN